MGLGDNPLDPPLEDTMMKPWTISFQVGETWYTMDELIYQTAKREVGKNWTNTKMVNWLRENGYEFTTDPKNGFITIS